MALSHDQILDLVKATQKELGRMKWTEIATDLSHYEVLPKMLKKDRVQFETGEGLQRNVMTEESGAAKHVGLYNVDDVNVSDVLQNIDVPFRHTTTNYAFDRREKAMNGGAEQIVDLIRVRRADSMISLAVLLESTFWSKPTDSTDKVTPFGLFYWIVQNASEGFNGGNPAGFSSGAGNLSSTTFPRWANYTNSYAASGGVSKTDLIKKLRKAHRKTDFRSPVDIPDYRTGRGQNYRLYVNESTISDMEDVGEGQNENLGRDLAPMDGTIAFRRNPVVYIPKLDDETNNPVFLVNWSVFNIFFLRGEHLREEGPDKVASQHNVYQVHVDLTWNTLCTNRRRLGVIYAA
tara:strand:+ start:740 stop:1783 length:1044 start_codon:yes stop_codon:yes gene_type:complete